jgi:hypothetical protein
MHGEAPLCLLGLWQFFLFHPRSSSMGSLKPKKPFLPKKKKIQKNGKNTTHNTDFLSISF